MDETPFRIMKISGSKNSNFFAQSLCPPAEDKDIEVI